MSDTPTNGGDDELLIDPDPFSVFLAAAGFPRIGSVHRQLH